MVMCFRRRGGNNNVKSIIPLPAHISFPCQRLPHTHTACLLCDLCGSEGSRPGQVELGPSHNLPTAQAPKTGPMHSRPHKMIFMYVCLVILPGWWSQDLCLFATFHALPGSLSCPEENCAGQKGRRLLEVRGSAGVQCLAPKGRHASGRDAHTAWLRDLYLFLLRKGKK